MADDVGWADDGGPISEDFGGLPALDEGEEIPAARVASRAECLLQLLAAYRDIADFDDIHQAAQRLAVVGDWIRREAQAAAADPLFAAEPILEPAHAAA